MAALAAILCLLISLAGCRGGAAPSAWTVEDLLLLDPLDGRRNSTEIIALYIRSRGMDLEIRIDLLDLPRTPDYDLKVWLSAPGEEIRLIIPADGRPRVESDRPGMQVRVRRDPRLDAVILALNARFVPQPFSLRVESFRPGSVTPQDETVAIRSDALPPVERAAVLLAFQDVFPAATPAQALRRLDGAHTGPIGGRHGLRYLLQAVERYRVPVVLLDLLTPASLAALDFSGFLPKVQQLQAGALLTLPQVACSSPWQAALDLSRQAAQDFGLSAGPGVYACGAETLPGPFLQFLTLEDPGHLATDGGTRLIPVSTLPVDQATQDGVSVEVRRLLLQAALSPDPSDLVVLGGSLPVSNWGTEERTGPSFAWMAGHPWVWTLSAADLLTYPLGASPVEPQSLRASPDFWQQAMEGAPNIEITRLAQLANLLLTNRAVDPSVRSLQQAYAGQIGILLAAAGWAEAPAPRADCASDPDRDGRAECLLSDGRCLAVIETNGGRLSHLFCVDDAGAHQLVAPSSQFTLGLSDPSEWDPSRGDGADPAALMGAFNETIGTYDEYTPRFTSEALILTNERVTKTFRMTDRGLQVGYQTVQPLTVRIPLALDAQHFYSSDGVYQGEIHPGEWTWALSGGPQIVVRSDADLTAWSYESSRLFLGFPEDPDQQFPPGHYLPFPLALVTLRGEGSFSTWIEFK